VRVRPPARWSSEVATGTCGVQGPVFTGSQACTPNFRRQPASRTRADAEAPRPEVGPRAYGPIVKGCAAPGAGPPLGAAGPEGGGEGLCGDRATGRPHQGAGVADHEPDASFTAAPRRHPFPCRSRHNELLHWRAVGSLADKHIDLDYSTSTLAAVPLARERTPISLRPIHHEFARIWLEIRATCLFDPSDNHTPTVCYVL
jgi:hypothetical protein